MSQLPRTIEKPSLAGSRVSDNSNFSTMDWGQFQDQRNVFASDGVGLVSQRSWLVTFQTSGVWPWSIRVKKFIMHGSNGVPVWGDRVEGFHKNEQNCLVESLGLTDLSNVSLEGFCLKMAFSADTPRLSFLFIFFVKKILFESMLYSPFSLPLSVTFV